MIRAALVALALVGCTSTESTRDPNGTFFFSVDLDLESPRLMGRGVVAVNDIIYVVTARQLRIVEFADGTFEQNRAIELHPDGPAEGHALVAGDGVLYVGDRFGISVFDLADPTIPALVHRLEVPSGVRLLARDGSMLVAATHAGALARVDISAPMMPALQGSVALDTTGEIVTALEVSGGRAVVGAFGLLWFVDVSGATPVLQARHELPYVGDFVRSDDLLYTGNDDALSIVDISDPQSPRGVGPANAPWRLGGAAPVIDGNRLYMAEYETSNVYVLDRSSPRAPTLERVLLGRSETIPYGYVQDMIFANDQIWQTHVGGMFSWVIDF